MNRRGFLTSMLKAGVAVAFLPSAVTYARQWKYTPIRAVAVARLTCCQFVCWINDQNPRYDQVIFEEFQKGSWTEVGRRKWTKDDINQLVLPDNLAGCEITTRHGISHWGTTNNGVISEKGLAWIKSDLANELDIWRTETVR